MATDEPPASKSEPTGDTVAGNVLRVRRHRGLTLRQLCDRLAELGHPMSTSALNRVENRTRKVDVDDLMALAVALDVSPLGLLLPRSERGDDLAKITGLEQTADLIWLWAAGQSSSAEERIARGVDNYNPREVTEMSLPRWLEFMAAVRVPPAGQAVDSSGPRVWPFERVEDPSDG